MRLVKALFVAILGLVVLLGAAIFLVPTERLANLAADQFETATGRQLNIGGEVGLSVFPVLGARAQDISIGNPDWAGEGELLRAAEMDIGVDLMSLFSGRVAVERVVLQSPVVTLRRAADGRATFDFAQPGAAAAAPQSAPSGGAMRELSLAEARIVDGTLRFVDETSDMVLDLAGLNASLSMPDMNGPLSLDADALLNRQPVTISLRAGNAATLLAGGLTALALEAEIAGAEASFEGRAALTDLVLEGRAQGALPALAPVLAALGQSGSEVPAQYRPIRFDGQVTRTASGQLFLREVAANAGDLAVTGAADVTLGGARPVVNAQLSIPVLNARGTGGGVDSGGAAASGWSREPIDASAVGLIDGEIALSIGEIRSDSGTFGPIRLRTEIENARAVTQIREARLFGGDVSGQFILNNRNGLSMRAVLDAAGISLMQLLRDTADFERLNGTAQASIDVLGSGNSLHAIMNSLQGQGSMTFSQGEILGLDLAGMLRNLDLGYVGEGTSTIYNSITGSFTMAGGVLSNDDLKLDSQRVQVDGRGQVGVGAQTLDYRIVPSALRDAEGNALRVPLIVTGPWSAPRFRLDMEALARERLEEERERLEALAREEAQRLEERARAEAEARIESELGVQREEGESLEDTVRRGVEGRITEELGRGLRGLLGGN
ncbi:AsmA family protein [Roseibaca sp. Y0-43]|uniref:AsmA family protein n=1 Tax=Roseibaca sp. Y0-43 TaxID=2816854 RepID=UPI001D0C1EB4|nr:AsmA family protein [Roseibaca sp. Y0-43]MCC1481939.1 AsmA family protein [Roseibaca sp. Y0-43]